MAPSFKLANLEVTPDGIAERSGEQRIAFVPRDGIERLEVAHGFVAERQLVQLVIGALLIVSGVYLVGAVRIVTARTLLLGPSLIVFGILAVTTSLRRGRHLRVQTARGVRKLRLDRRSDELTEQSFLAEARRILAL
jgi:hypothetical protein